MEIPPEKSLYGQAHGEADDRIKNQKNATERPDTVGGRSRPNLIFDRLP